MDDRDPTGSGTPTLFGVDLGSSTVKIVWVTAEHELLHRAAADARGRPLDALSRLLSQLPVSPTNDRAVRVAITGSVQALPPLFPCLGVNEVVATARGVHDRYPQARTAIDLGGQFSKWIQLASTSDQRGMVVDFASNGLCAAGAGTFLEQQASRLGLSVQALGELATTAARAASIAGRCSVFAKSDMIHLQQKGTPSEEIAYGLCMALARTFLSTVASGRPLLPPVVLVGGGACNPGIVRAFRALLKLADTDLFAAVEAPFLGATGAAHLAASAPVTDLATVVCEVQAIASPTLRGDCAHHCQVDTNLAPLVRRTPTPAEMLSEDPTPVEGDVQGFLGLDVGSVSTNLAVLDLGGTLLQGVYLPTRGRPVDALQQGLRLIAERFGNRLTICGVGTTGSGRHLAGQLVGADVVHNEITAQLVSALRYVPDADTIFEIGGQDSKYISVCDGRLADFQMNKICAGGTGSFLEEQAQRLGINIIQEFADLAFEATHPCDLGVRCTVFMDTELVRAQERGVALPDLCAGLAYSVARNYIEKVVAGRPIGTRIVFQGGTASNAAVAQAIRQVLGREVTVHPYNRISGAIGAALLAARAHLKSSAFLGFNACNGSELRSFSCYQCETRCEVNRIRVGGRTLHFGDICERYAQHDSDVVATRRPFAELFAQREQLFERWSTRTHSAPAPARRLGLLRGSLNLEFLPFWMAFLSELRFEPVVAGKSTADILQRGAGGVPSELCLPIKIAAAQAHALLADGTVERIFVPAVLECPPRAESDQSHTCLYGQQLPDLLRVNLGERIVTCQFSLGHGLLSLVGPVLALADSLERPVDEVVRALRKAEAAQSRFAAARRQLGAQALASTFDRAVVVLGRPYNTHDTFLNLSLAHHLNRLNVPAIPWDLLPLEGVALEARWDTVPWHYSREQLRAMRIIQTDPRLFPLLVSNYGCGPDGFIVKHLEELVGDRPRLFLEFDEHRGEAGLVTRLEAFADEIEEHVSRREQRSLRQASATTTPGRRTHPLRRRVFVPNFAPHAAVYAATLRGAGFETEVLPAPDRHTVQLGDQLASGRECHPYAILAGELARLAGRMDVGQDDVFLVPNCATPCLLNQYADGYRILLARQHVRGPDVWEATTEQLAKIVGVSGMMRLYEGLLATDILVVLGNRLHPYVIDKPAFDAEWQRALLEVPSRTTTGQPLEVTTAMAIGRLWAMPRTGEPGSRPVVGITGDLYSRLNPLGNAGLFERLEGLGLEVWSSPYFATMNDLASALDWPHRAEKGMLKAAALDYLGWTVGSWIGKRIVQHLPAEIVALTVEPPVDELIALAKPFVGPRTSHLVVLVVAKMADFLRRGAKGVVNATALNCMVGTATAALVPSVRAHYDGAPIINLVYGGEETPSQRVRLETFVEQVRGRWQRTTAA